LNDLRETPQDFTAVFLNGFNVDIPATHASQRKLTANVGFRHACGKFPQGQQHTS
jgi:hypothetical protein